MRKATTLIAAALLVVSALAGHSPEEWKARSVYQVLTDRIDSTNGSKGNYCNDLKHYCGGTFKGIENHLDYIKGMGFDAIWISPIVKNWPGSYHGYHCVDLYSINENFGSEQDLKDLISAAHSKDIWVMVDVVGNHMAPTNDFSQLKPFNSQDHYHSQCDINFNDQNSIEQCWLAGLADLNQENDWVAQQLYDWAAWLQSEYGFDGFRLDTERHVRKSFWREFNDKAGAYMVGEVFDGNTDYVLGYQGVIDGVFHYPMYYTLNDVYGSGQSMYNIRNRLNECDNYKSEADQNMLGVFISNHDNPRWLHNHNNQNNMWSALAYVFFGRGIPFFYYGDEQGFSGGNDPDCREPLWNDFDTTKDMYQRVKKMNDARREHKTWESPYVERYVADNFFAFSRGDVLIATTNDSNNEIKYSVTYNPFSAGDRVCNIFYDSDCLTITNDGALEVVLKGGEAKIYVRSSSTFEEQSE